MQAGGDAVGTRVAEPCEVVGFGRSTVLEVVADPQITSSANDYGEGRFVCTRGDISVVVAPAVRVVITVLWHTYDVWTNEEFRNRSHPLAVGRTATGLRCGSGQASSGAARSAA